MTDAPKGEEIYSDLKLIYSPLKENIDMVPTNVRK